MPEEAFELTEFVTELAWLLFTGLATSARCCRTASIPFVSNGVLREPNIAPDSLIVGGSCKVRSLGCSIGAGKAPEGACCTFATMAGLSISYC